MDSGVIKLYSLCFSDGSETVTKEFMSPCRGFGVT